jgi:outer membrane protein assembly factor BamA
VRREEPRGVEHVSRRPTSETPSTDTSPNRLRVSLAIGQTTIGVATDRFGTTFGGSVGFLFGDVLGDHLLETIVQLNGGVKDIGGQAVYQNMKHRLNWGGGVQHIPYLTGAFFTSPDTAVINGQPVPAQLNELIKQRVYLDGASVLASYPLSTNRRLEVGTGFTRVSYSFEADRVLTVNGTVVDEETVGLDAPPGLNLFQSSLAYVGDYSFFGFTSPVRGSRFRFEVDPSFGSIRYLTVLTDYRQYFFVNPFTFAFRGLHIGRYLKDSDSDRLTPLYIGYETLVRGYDLNFFDPGLCVGSIGDSRCFDFNRLTGSRIAVVNAEFRIPVLGTDQFGLVNFPYLPTEAAVFFDGGVAWTKDEPPTFKLTSDPNERSPVYSAGFATRTNLFGALVAQLYLAFPFQRPGTMTQFGFVLAPGW